MLRKINTLNFLKAPSLNKVAKLNKPKKLKNLATLWREFQSLLLWSTFFPLYVNIYALKNRVKVKASNFHFIVWFYKLRQRQTKEVTTS